ncbi:MAG: carboxypeptidase-like regulatory domain-containing protein, partial [Candidatus Acidiferrum sp.]
MKTTLLRSAFLFLAVLAVSFSAPAQNQSSYAHLFGTLLDSSGAAVAGISVTAQLEGGATAQPWKAVSSADGAYSLSVPPGRYHVSFQRSPFV